MHLCRGWRKVRLVYTEKLLTFGSSAGEVIDVLPIKEIIAVRSAAEARRRALATHHKDSTLDLDDEDATNDEEAAATTTTTSNVLTIHTQLDGYNAGCVYRVRAATIADHNLLIDDIGRIATAARERSLARSRFGRTQERVRVVFTSNPVQKFVALLILVVRSACPSPVPASGPRL
jgi:hypothetical protein